MSRPKTKQADRVILFEVGLIIALLFVNWMLETKYVSTDSFGEEFIFPEDTLIVYGPIFSSPPEPEAEDPIKNIQTSSFNPSRVIDLVDDLFAKDKNNLLDLAKGPKRPIGRIPLLPAGDQSFKVDTFVERMPHFPGGELALRRFIQENFHSTDAMYNYGGKVELVVSFIVHKDGQLSDYQVVSSNVNGLGAESQAVKLFDRMPDWVPGHNGQQAVNVRLLLPITIQMY